MGSLSKLRKLSNVDRISDLPDSLLLHILSFLPVKSAALTSSLSKRWLHLFMSLPILDFDDDDFSQKPTTFTKFVDYMLMTRTDNVILERFSLNCGAHVDADHVDSWLWRPVKYYSVQVIKLYLAFTEPYKLPTEVYTCTTLQVLSLSWNILIDVPEILSLPRLSILELCEVTLSSSHSFEKLLLNCPVLEQLLIQDCACRAGNRVNIFGNALKTLRLQQGVELEFLIDAPAVVHLYVDISEAVEIKTQMLFLETATIDGYPQNELGSVHTDGVFRLLGMISHVRRLTLTSNTIVALSRASACTFPTFHNLTDLKLLIDGGAGPAASWSLLPKILASSPILANLVFPHGLARDFYANRKLSRFSFIPPETVPECLSFHLKNIEIGDFRGIAEEFITIQYLLKHGRVLNMMSIDCSHLWLKEMTLGVKRKPHRSLILSEMKEKLSEFPRCSTSCKLDLSP
ncbi:hypothetical protein POM88_022028 [Heracleum sosnowskyi]|uniref:F-box domain-containing protein n=1 Tax=Heracleum sosnowskyi TaxID=360622 RepID=A0AAD8IFR8_9APIA|nr:hypothetical protein POM88_022028 [Heracleum sosnowskyi]